MTAVVVLPQVVYVENRPQLWERLIYRSFLFLSFLFIFTFKYAFSDYDKLDYRSHVHPSLTSFGRAVSTKSFSSLIVTTPRSPLMLFLVFRP